MAAGLILHFPPSVGEHEYDAVSSHLGMNMRTKGSGQRGCKATQRARPKTVGS